MNKSEIFEIFEPLSDVDSKSITGGTGGGGGSSSNELCDQFEVCGLDATNCTEETPCGDGSWILACEDTEKCWSCRAYYGAS